MDKNTTEIKGKGTGTDVGPGLAWSYFYGFLKLILKGMLARIEKSEFNDPSKFDPKMCQQVIILLPESCFCPSTLTDDDPEHFKHVGYIPFKASRAGNVERDYKSSVYEVTNPTKPTEKYLIVAELATPLMSMYEMQIDGLADFPETRKLEERIKFIDTLRFILTQPKTEGECKDAYTLLEYKDPRDDKGRPQYNLAEIICSHVQGLVQNKLNN